MNIGAFFSGGISPYWPHAVLIGVSLLGSVAVTWGLIREEKLWSVTALLIVGGVIIEALCTLLLFGFDEGISDAQQSELTKADRALVAEIERNTLRGLTKDQYEAIQSLKGKLSAVRILWSPILDSYLFALDIADAFKDAGIKVYSPSGRLPLTLPMEAAPPDLWGVGTTLYDPSSTPGEGPIFSALQRADLVGGAMARPNFAASWQPDIPIIIIGARGMLPAHPSYSPKNPFSPN